MSPRFKAFWLVLVAGVVGLASFLPLLWALGQPMPGFIYSPFYTANIFNNATLNGYKAGLRPEDRVIQVNRQRIEQLTPLAAQGGELYLTYELKQALVTIYVQSQNWTFARLLETSGPLLAIGLWLIWRTSSLMLQGSADNRFLVAALFLSGLALLAAPDYFLAAGAGRESGFDPVYHWQQGQYLAMSAKWSSYFYFPLWTLAASAWSYYFLQRILSQRRAGVKRWIFASTFLLLCFDLGDYLFSALRTMHYNNPDYLVFHARNEFWLLWPLVLILGWLDFWGVVRIGKRAAIRRTTMFQIVGLTIFVIAFIFPTVFDLSLPFLGVQWWAVPLSTVTRYIN